MALSNQLRVTQVSPETSSVHHLHGGSKGNSICSETKSTVSVLLRSQNHEIKIKKHQAKFYWELLFGSFVSQGIQDLPSQPIHRLFNDIHRRIRPLKISSMQSIDCRKVLCISGGTFYKLLMLFSNAQGRYFSSFSFQIKSECRVVKHKN